MCYYAKFFLLLHIFCTEQFVLETVFADYEVTMICTFPQNKFRYL